jgi:DNA-binding beta-propeller fold protein YncE
MITELRDDVITMAYGREKALLAPRYVTTDSKGRAIVSDPAAQSVHVLDGENPFRIVAGRGHRLQSVGAVAVDKFDNIYVADPQAGVVIVFDSVGRFVREIGRISADEGLFHETAAIAVDRQRHLLYVADTSRDLLMVLNADGNVLQRAGGRRLESGATFSHPVAVTVKHDRIVVLDLGGARVQIFDLRWKLLQSFETKLVAGYSTELGLDIDLELNVYVSNIGGKNLRIFEQHGSLVGEFGAAGVRRGEFGTPAAIWIDADNRLYVAERHNRRVQLFQISGTATR